MSELQLGPAIVIEPYREVSAKLRAEFSSAFFAVMAEKFDCDKFDFLVRDTHSGFAFENDAVLRWLQGPFGKPVKPANGFELFENHTDLLFTMNYDSVLKMRAESILNFDLFTDARGEISLVRRSWRKRLMRTATTAMMLLFELKEDRDTGGESFKYVCCLFKVKLRSKHDEESQNADLRYGRIDKTDQLKRLVIKLEDVFSRFEQFITDAISGEQILSRII